MARRGHKEALSFDATHRLSSRWRRPLLWLLCASLVISTENAFADDPSPGVRVNDQSAAAEDLFQQARGFLVKREFAKACPMLLESYRLDPAGGTLQNLAICYEELGKWASAYARFQELRAVSKSIEPPRQDRIKLADEHIAKLTPKLSRVVIVVPPESAATVKVSLDGVEYLQPSWGAGVLVDPGGHELVVSAKGKKSFQKTIAVPADAGGRQEVRVPVLEDEAVAAVAPTTPSGTSPAPAPESTSSLRTAGLVVGGIGIGALVAGGVFGVLTFTTDSAAKDKCSPGANPNAAPSDFDPSGRCYLGTDRFRSATDLTDTARTFANVANVLVPVGLVGIGVGVYLAFIHKDASPSNAASSVRFAPGLGGATLSGTF